MQNAVRVNGGDALILHAPFDHRGLTVLRNLCYGERIVAPDSNHAACRQPIDGSDPLGGNAKHAKRADGKNGRIVCASGNDVNRSPAEQRHRPAVVHRGNCLISRCPDDGGAVRTGCSQNKLAILNGNGIILRDPSDLTSHLWNTLVHDRENKLVGKFPFPGRNHRSACPLERNSTVCVYHGDCRVGRAPLCPIDVTVER